MDPEIRGELRTLPKSLAELVAKHLVAAGDLLDQDPERAYQHALYARRRASRVGAVREAAGVAAYTVGRWQEALSELRAARRITGQDTYLPMIADCERGVGRPERALEIAHGPGTDRLDMADQIELRIVASGARRDMGDLQGALVELQCPQLKERRARPWVARLFYAYADVLLELGRKEEAREYFSRASAVDREGVTDADERLAVLEGLEIVDVGDDVVWSDAEEPDFDDFSEGDGGAAAPETGGRSAEEDR
ncbi:tetratricopeptide repeat protein [Thermobifida halotolerans]|uniref:Tetratricopeptide repeat protein n=1 Tax=Thermobifida halotolerans TaxID=483545 RepID=A0AA97M2A9_9ACTN|nr:tetratricopeptide repeat protein [Thermobifida halotolerans]